MGIVHVAIYDAALAIEGGYEPYAIGIHAPDASSAAAVATAAHHVLVGLQPAVGLNVDQQAILDGDYVAYVASIPEGDAKAKGIEVGRRVADAVLALRRDDGRDKNPRYGEPPFVPPPEAAGVWRPDAARPVLGLRIPGITPLALEAAWQFRPDGPNPLTSTEYAEDLAQLEEVGGSESTARTRLRRPPKRSSGPITTPGSGTMGCSASRPRTSSASSRRRGCWQWRTSRAATR